MSARTIPKPLALLARVWPPMLATLAQEEDVPPTYDVLETKYDGFRAIAAVCGGKVALQSRNALDLAARFDSVAKALQAFTKHDLVIDGELIPHRGRSFHSLQIGSHDVDYMVFDLLWLDGNDLRREPLSKRRAALEALLKGAPARLRLGERLQGPLHKALQRARREEMEGVLCKRSESTYQGGRQRDWLKVKLLKADEFAIVGFVQQSKGLPQIGALCLATLEKKPRYAGKVGTGFTNKLRTDLFHILSKLRVDTPAVSDPPRERDIVWCSPTHIAEVTYAELTPDGRLRHPSFQRLREDKE